MSTKDALVELDQALTRFEGIEKRIVERQPKEKAEQGKARLALLRANVVEAKRELTGVAPPVEPPPDSPPIVTPPSGGKVFRENLNPRGKGGYGSPVRTGRPAPTTTSWRSSTATSRTSTPRCSS
jgi:hypothetical protein